MPRVLVILSGSGVYDGSEIHEAVCILLHLDRHGAEVTCAAPDIDQLHVIDHLRGEPTDERRNALVESARIARGHAVDLASLRGADFDAVVLPGGFGAAKNLCDFAVNAERCTVNEQVERVLREAHGAGRPIGLACIAPVIAARLFPTVTVTIGTDESTAAAIGAMGATHASRAPDAICTDEANRIVTTPAYMSAHRISEVYAGIGKMIDAVMEMANVRPVASSRAAE